MAGLSEERSCAEALMMACDERLGAQSPAALMVCDTFLARDFWTSFAHQSFPPTVFLLKKLLARVVQSAGKQPTFLELPVVSPLANAEQTAEVFRECPVCANPMVCGTPTQPIYLHGTHFACEACAARFSCCCICHAETPERRPATAEELCRVVATQREASKNAQQADAIPDPGPGFVAINISLFSPQCIQSYGADERWCMIRGSRPYYCPSGWTRFGIDVPGFDQAFKLWPVAYHSTAPERVLSILQFGLLNPGARTPLGVLHGGADDQLIRVSPSIEYAANDLDSKPLQLADGRWAQVVLQVRVWPSSFRIGGITLQPEHWPHDLPYDDFFHNSELLWSMQYRECVVIYGVMVRITDEHPRAILERKKEAIRVGAYPKQLPFIWQWYDGTNFIDYNPGMQMLIEAAFQRQDPQVFFHIGTNHNMYYIDFKEMKQFRSGNEGLRRRVRRIPRPQI